MRGYSRQKTVLAIVLQGALLGLTCILIGCSGGSEEEGRIRVVPTQVVGVYEWKLDDAVERLELKGDGIYVQDTVWQSHPVHHTGKWRIQNHFFDSSEVILTDAAIVPFPLSITKSEKGQLGFGQLPMYAHQRSGRVALARNEVADWYYERMQ